MLTIKCISDKPCFICGKHDHTADVSFADKTFRGVLCMEHVYEKLKPEKPEKEPVRPRRLPTVDGGSIPDSSKTSRKANHGDCARNGRDSCERGVQQADGARTPRDFAEVLG